MNNKMVKDERVVSAKRKIQSDGFALVWLLLWVSVLVQQFVFNAPLSQYLVELVIVLAMSFYILVANVLKGNDLNLSNSKRSKVLMIVQSLIAGATVAVINTVQNYYQYGDVVQDTIVQNTIAVAAVTFISATVGTFLVLKVVAWINTKRQDRINDRLNIDE